MKIKEVVSALERFAPLPLQDGFDNAGLQIGLTEAEVSGALLCLDVTEQVIDEAIVLGCNLILSHHPLIFKGYKSITGRDYVERCIIKAIKHDIVIYSAHTNLDNAFQGVNYRFADIIGLKNVRVLEPKQGELVKLVTFVPLEAAKKVRQALFAAGCGHIGNYDSCGYQLEGEGTFRALSGAHPYVGEIGELHTEKEVRVETILPAYAKHQAISALLWSHPYEEPAYDIYPLQNEWSQVGSGIIGELEHPEEELTFLKRIKEHFNVGCLKHNMLTGKMIHTVALCGGSGNFLLPTAIRQNADVFLTGEFKYHDYFGQEGKILMAEIGHYESELHTVAILDDLLRTKFPNLMIKITKVNTNPIKYL